MSALSEQFSDQPTYSTVDGVPYKLCGDGSYKCAVCGSFILNRTRHSEYHREQREEAIVCPECGGKGQQPGMPGMDCGSCLGTGTEIVEAEA